MQSQKTSSLSQDKQVRFGDDPRSMSSQPLQIDEHDSEDPDESPEENQIDTAKKTDLQDEYDDEEEEYDPRIEQKIQKIKSNFMTSGDMTKDNTSASNAVVTGNRSAF